MIITNKILKFFFKDKPLVRMFNRQFLLFSVGIVYLCVAISYSDSKRDFSEQTDEATFKENLESVNYGITKYV